MDDIYIYLDNRILLAHEYFYNKENKCYNIKQVSIDDIKNIKNLKLIPEENKINFLINQIFNTSINFIKKNELKYIFKRSGIYDCNIELSIYQNNEIKDEENNKNESMKLLLSEFLIYEQTKHIIIPIFNLDIKLKNLHVFLNKFNTNEEIYKLNNENSNKMIKINITEHFFKQKFLNDLFNDNNFEIIENDFKILLFQIIHTLAVIKTKYNGFSHNNLTLNNILVYITDKNKSKRIYKFNNKEYEINNIGFDIRIDNFENSDLYNNNNNDLNIFIESLKNITKINIFIKNNKNISNLISNIINIKDPINIMNSTYFNDLLKINNNKKNDKNYEITSSSNSEKSDDFKKNKYIKGVRTMKNTKKLSEKISEKVKNKKKLSKKLKNKKKLSDSLKKSSKTSSINKNYLNNNNLNNLNNLNNNNNNLNNNNVMHDFKTALKVTDNELNILKMSNDVQPLNNQFGQQQLLNEQFGQQQHLNNQFGQQQLLNDQFGQQQLLNNQFGQQQLLNDQFGQQQHLNNQFGQQPHLNNQFGQQSHLNNYMGGNNGLNNNGLNNNGLNKNKNKNKNKNNTNFFF